MCLASVFTIVESIKYPSKTKELPRDAAPSFIWGNVEMNIAIVSGIYLCQISRGSLAHRSFSQPVFHYFAQSSVASSPIHSSAPMAAAILSAEQIIATLLSCPQSQGPRGGTTTNRARRINSRMWSKVYRTHRSSTAVMKRIRRRYPVICATHGAIVLANAISQVSMFEKT